MDHILFFVNCIKLVWENITHMAHGKQEGGKDLTCLILNTKGFSNTRKAVQVL